MGQCHCEFNECQEYVFKQVFFACKYFDLFYSCSVTIICSVCTISKINI